MSLPSETGVMSLFRRGVGPYFHPHVNLFQRDFNMWVGRWPEDPSYYRCGASTAAREWRRVFYILSHSPLLRP